LTPNLSKDGRSGSYHPPRHPLITVLAYQQINLQGRGAARGGTRGAGNAFKGRHGGPQGPQPTMDKPKREAILDLSKYVNERIRVKFTGGREGMTPFLFLLPGSILTTSISFRLVTGILKGYDQLLNLVLDEVQEEIIGMQVVCVYQSSY
jgi:small nuclear ribonucleoprotein (snRNP)-like protein